MLDHAKIVSDKIEFYRRDIDNPYSVNGFRGTWQFSDHNLIPDVFNGFLQRYFGQYRIRRVPLAQINEVLNQYWEGPGSLEKIFKLEEEMRANGKDVKFTSADVAAIKAKKVEDEDDDVLPDLPLSQFGISNEEFEEDE